MVHITVRQFEVFVQVAERLSFVRAAETLRLTPSAVSFQVRQIEQQTGFALFERIGRTVALTEAGRVLLDYARPVLQAMRDVDEAMAALKGVGGGRVRLGLVSTAKYIVPHMIARFRMEYPGVTVHLQEGNRSLILALLLAGSIDLAIMGQPPEGADVVAARFADHPSVIIAAPARSEALPLDPGKGQSPFANPLLNDFQGPALNGVEGQRPCLATSELRTDPLPASALANEWFVIREDGSGTRSLSDRFFATAGFMPRIAMETSSNEMIKQAVMAGMGLALLSQHTISLEESLGLLRVLAVVGTPVMRAWFVVQRRISPLLPVQARLRSYLIEHGAAIIGEVRQRQAAAGHAVTPAGP